jgi:hypothetical protein
MLGLCVCSIARADEERSDGDVGSTFWVNVGGGPATSDKQLDYGLGISANRVAWRHHLFAARFATLEDYPGGIARRFEYALMYGRTKHWRRVQLSAATGLALVDGKDPLPLLNNERRRYDEFTEVGFPVELQGYFRATSAFGIGISQTFDFNSKGNFGVTMFSIQFGTRLN